MPKRKPSWEFKVAPDAVTGEQWSPWAHQLDSFERWKDKAQYAPLWEMGTGKTSIGANLLARRFARKDVAKAVILLPQQVSYAWQHELWAGHGLPSLNLSDVGSSAKREKMLRENKATIALMNYEGLVGIEDPLLDWLGKDYASLADESTFIKNARAQCTKAADRIGYDAHIRHIFTGTLLPQGPQDVFGQYLFLDHTIYGRSFVNFRSQWLKMGGFQAKQILGLQRGKEEAFNELIYSVADRRTKAECLGMPPKNYATPVRYKLSPAEKKVYDDLAQHWVAEVRSGKITTTNGMTRSLRLAQACTGFVGDREAGETKIYDIGSGSKLKALDGLLDTVDGKVIVWCAWLKNVQDISKLLTKRKIKHVIYDSTNKDKHGAEMAFRSDPDIRVFLGTGTSGGPGLNLQGPEVKTVIYFSQNYSNFYRMQSEDRAHRGSIKHTVTIIDMVAEKTVEESIIKGLRGKRDFQEFLLQDPEKFVGGLL